MPESTRIHGPAATAPVVSNTVVHCQACKTQWVLQLKAERTTLSCPFCGASGAGYQSALTFEDERPTLANYQGQF